MSTIKANTLLHSDGSTTTQPSIPALDKRMAKAWVNFNGQGTVAIYDSFNISSITDNGTGLYAANYSVNMPSADGYAYFISSGKSTNYHNAPLVGTKAASYISFLCTVKGTSTKEDANHISVGTFSL